MNQLAKSHSRGLILLLLSACIAMGASVGCRTTNDRDVFIEALNANVDDEERRGEIQEVFDRRNAQQDVFLQKVGVLQARLQDAIADIDTPAGDHVTLHEEFDRAWNEMRDEVINGSLELRSLMSEEEWAVMSDLDADTIVSRSVAPQQP